MNLGIGMDPFDRGRKTSCSPFWKALSGNLMCYRKRRLEKKRRRRLALTAGSVAQRTAIPAIAAPGAFLLRVLQFPEPLIEADAFDRHRTVRAG